MMLWTIFITRRLCSLVKASRTLCFVFLNSASRKIDIRTTRKSVFMKATTEPVKLIARDFKNSRMLNWLFMFARIDTSLSKFSRVKNFEFGVWCRELSMELNRS